MLLRNYRLLRPGPKIHLTDVVRVGFCQRRCIISALTTSGTNSLRYFARHIVNQFDFTSNPLVNSMVRIQTRSRRVRCEERTSTAVFARGMRQCIEIGVGAGVRHATAFRASPFMRREWDAATDPSAETKKTNACRYPACRSTARDAARAAAALYTPYLSMHLFAYWRCDLIDRRFPVRNAGCLSSQVARCVTVSSLRVSGPPRRRAHALPRRMTPHCRLYQDV
ncbi:hypothetical protein EVAR_87837_1 [Eumeta japonica]|uniref:Uncharacterized protein n=1 Tax=Eumeta variegata TaxID=151549 RepID=A0A4C1YGP0_EUMVA|nr:hypothetical protein EVAR_87837_1 [Eumeta japonica]